MENCDKRNGRLRLKFTRGRRKKDGIDTKRLDMVVVLVLLSVPSSFVGSCVCVVVDVAIGVGVAVVVAAERIGWE